MLDERGGFPIVNMDGAFGPSTDQSVKHYQQNENLTVDGIVGKQTWTSATVGARLIKLKAKPPVQNHKSRPSMQAPVTCPPPVYHAAFDSALDDRSVQRC
jgi:peptidoglycan hydrolase-like protein with peptidoglycan-binding domain